MKKLTYFTPTYNRKTLLGNLYESLLKQSCKDFIWLIIDDGSIDDTKSTVEKWIKENKLQIKYVYKENGGKNTAMDFAHQICETEFICCVDSDDLLTVDCTEILYGYFDKLKSSNIVGIVGRRANYKNTPFSICWPENIEEICFYDIKKKYGYDKDTVLVFKTDIIQKYSFPKINDERFITESVFYNQFLYMYKVLMIPECVYLTEYQQDGYTNQGYSLFFKNPKGMYYAYLSNAFYLIKYSKQFKEKVIAMSMMYSIRKLFDYKNLFKGVFYYNLFYKICGKLGMVITYPRLKSNYKRFLKRNDKNATYKK